MENKILFDLLDLQEGKEITLMSKRKDLFLNNKIEEYSIYKKDRELYIKKLKKIGLNKVVEYNEKIKELKVGKSFLNKLEKTNLTAKEIKLMCENSREKYFIRENCSIEGTFVSGLDFNYKNIIAVS